MAGANFTSANCLSSTGWPFLTVTTRLCKSSIRLLRPSTRMRNSWPWACRKPPLVFAPKSRSASSSFSRSTPSACNWAGMSSTRYCLTSPPIGMTCATPGIVKRRGRITQSAYSRTAIGLTLAGSIGRAISSTSPMMDEIGPICGTTPAGKLSRTKLILSAICWRLR